MTNILIKDFIIVLMIFLRIFSAFIAAPVFGDKAIPMIVKIFLSFIIAYILFTTLKVDNVIINYSLGSIGTNAVKEIITGLIIGFTFNLVFHGISFAGSLIGFDIGMSMASVMNPMDETQSNVVSQMIFYLALFVFFLIDGHHHIIKALYSSVLVIPIGQYSINESVYNLLIKYTATVFIIAIKIASPVLVSFFLIHLAEGITSRVIPQMQVFFVTQPLKIGVGMILLSFLIPTYFFLIKNLLGEYEEKLFQLIRAMG